MTLRAIFLVAAVLGFLAVAFGAFGAHGLRDRVTPAELAAFQTAVLYQFLHALALFGLGLAAFSGVLPFAAVQRISLLFFAGVLIFSGSLYALVLTSTPTLGMITPFGGLSFLAGWLMLAWAVYSSDALGARFGE